jgi:hypothetical protein
MEMVYLRHPHTGDVKELAASDTDAISQAMVAGYGQIPAPPKVNKPAKNEVPN